MAANSLKKIEIYHTVLLRFNERGSETDFTFIEDKQAPISNQSGSPKNGKQATFVPPLPASSLTSSYRPGLFAYLVYDCHSSVTKLFQLSLGWDKPDHFELF